MKKLLLTLLGASAMLPTFAQDFTYTYEGQTLGYDIINDTQCKVHAGYVKDDGYISAGQSISGELVIPEYAMEDGWRDYEVVGIGEFAFTGNKLTSVTLPSTIKEIEQRTFQGCQDLTSVALPDAIETIGDYAFYHTDALNYIYFPTQLTSIGEGAFWQSGLNWVIIPPSVTSLGLGAFHDCYVGVGAYPSTFDKPFTHSPGVTLLYSEFFIAYDPDSATFENGILYGADKEKVLMASHGYEGQLTLPETVKSIGDYAFYECFALTSVEMSNSVKSIGNYAFYDCSALTSVEMGNLVESIGECAFFGCSALTSVEMGDSVKSIGDYAFYDCSALTSVEMGNSVESIGEEAFEDCSALISVLLPPSLKSVGDWAFNGCGNLIKSAYPNSISNPFSSGVAIPYDPNGAVIEDGVLYGAEKKEILFAPISLQGDFVVPESVNSIGKNAFALCSGLTSINLPEGVSSIAEDAFSSCSGLAKAEFGSIEQICNMAFATGTANPLSYAHHLYVDGQEIKDLEIPESVDSIGKYAFYGCNALTSVKIASSVESIGVFAFYNCSGLAKAEFGSIEQICNMAFANENANPLYYAHHLYVDGQEIKDLEIPESVDSIGNYAFSGCSALTSVIIPSSVTSVATNAFNNCSGLIKSAYPSSLRNPFPSGAAIAYDPESVVFENEFIYNGNKQSLLFASIDYEGKFTVPESVTSIGQSAFLGCTELSSLILPEYLETIGDYAFKGCTALRDLTLPNRITKWTATGVFAGTSLVKGAYPDEISNPFPSSVTATAYNAFDSNVENGFVYSRNKNALYYVPLNVRSDFAVPATVTEIGDKAFYACENLTAVTLPAVLDKLGASVWDGCQNLQSVTCLGSTPVVAERDLFMPTVYNNGTLYIPQGSLKDYQDVIPWKYFYDIKEKDFSGVETVFTEDNATSIDFAAPVEVYDLKGTRVADSMDNLPKGIYIVRQGAKVQKVMK